MRFPDFLNQDTKGRYGFNIYDVYGKPSVVLSWVGSTGVSDFHVLYITIPVFHNETGEMRELTGIYANKIRQFIETSDLPLPSVLAFVYQNYPHGPVHYVRGSSYPEEPYDDNLPLKTRILHKIRHPFSHRQKVVS